MTTVDRDDLNLSRLGVFGNVDSDDWEDTDDDAREQELIEREQRCTERERELDRRNREYGQREIHGDASPNDRFRLFYLAAKEVWDYSVRIVDYDCVVDFLADEFGFHGEREDQETEQLPYQATEFVYPPDTPAEPEEYDEDVDPFDLEDDDEDDENVQMSRWGIPEASGAQWVDDETVQRERERLNREHREEMEQRRERHRREREERTRYNPWTIPGRSAWETDGWDSGPDW